MEQTVNSSQELTEESAQECIQEESSNSNVVLSQQPSMDQEMMNMFASVWVKVEVNDIEENANNALVDPDIAYNEPKRRKPKLPQRFKCERCDYTTAYRNCLKLHILGHDGLKPFSCSACEYTTKYPTALNRHMLIKHQSEGQVVNAKSASSYKCDDCDYTTFYKWNLHSHRQKHKNVKEYKCTQCDYKTGYRHHYTKHTKRHSRDDKNMVYKCDQCPFVTRFDGHITRHLAKIHNIVSDKANRCDYCDFSTKVNWRLTIHKTRSKQKEVIKCVYCGFETFYMCQSKVHKRKHFKELGKGINKEAPDTNENDSNETELNVKLDEIVTSDKTQKYTLDPDCLDWHNIEILESSDKDRPFQCHMCNYSARFKASVQRHFQRRHTGSQNRPYKCVNCDFSTKTKDQIALHNKRSQSQLLIHCTQCNFVTKYKCQYAMHQKTHYDQKCTDCDFKCRNKYEMQKHYTIVHLGDGLKCQYCDFQATRKESLMSHETIHTGIKPFKCTVPLCEYTSVRKSLLRNHMQRFHSDIPDDVTIISDNRIQSLKLPVDHIVQTLESNNSQ